ncbi:MAG: YHS domain-containing protein [Acidobacteria bacterium]|nr:YHS domain-containing protein [Acidobacteriota bacterium]
MLKLLVRILEIVAILWLLRLLWRTLFATVARNRTSAPTPSPNGHDRAPRMIQGEMQRDPQCGMFVSTELSIKSRFRGQQLHFCSPECRDKFLQIQAGKSA